MTSIIPMVIGPRYALNPNVDFATWQGIAHLFCGLTMMFSEPWQVGGVQVDELNGMETEFLFLTSFNLHVKRTEYDAFVAELYMRSEDPLQNRMGSLNIGASPTSAALWDGFSGPSSGGSYQSNGSSSSHGFNKQQQLPQAPSSSEALTERCVQMFFSLPLSFLIVCWLSPKLSLHGDKSFLPPCHRHSPC
jgi:hypothetical protein